MTHSPERPLRIAVVETSSHGGLLHYAVKMADALAARGHDTELIVPAANELAGAARQARVRAVLPTTVRGTIEPSARLAYQARRVGIAWRLTRSWGRIIAAARRRDYDAMIINCDLHIWLAAGAALLLTLRPRRPLLADVCHNSRPYNRWNRHGLFVTSSLLTRLLCILYPRLDLVLVHGARSRSVFEATWPPSRLVQIPFGNERLFDNPPGPAAEERILFFGDWRKVKGLGVLMEAFDELATRRPTARLTIAGTPSDADYDSAVVRGWARRHGDRVEVIDRYVPLEEVPAVFGRARVVANPYLVGFQSAVVHLAMSMGRAVVASDVGDLPDAVLHGQTGQVVPPGDASALANALEYVIADPDVAASFGRAGREHAERHGRWEEVADVVVDAMREARRRDGF